MTYEDILKDIYYNPTHPASFASIKKLFAAGKAVYPQLTIENVKDWLSAQNTYTLHRDARRHYSREKILVNHPYEQFQADLVDMQAFSRANGGHKYILTMIDCFSRYAFAIPIKNKTGADVRNALKSVFDNVKPDKLQTDRGKEFLNKQVQDMLKEKEIQFFTTHNSSFKCAIVERFNRTLKSKMFKYFSYKGTRKYIDVLEQLLASYNNAYHRTIKTTPSNVNGVNRDYVFKTIYGVDDEWDYLKSKTKTPKLSVGDKVRRKYELTPMDKGYYPNWTDNIYTVEDSIKGANKPMYRLKASDGSLLPQKFYPEEVQKIKENYYRIEKIIRRATQNGVRGFIVKWLGYSNLHNSFVPETEIRNVGQM